MSENTSSEFKKLQKNKDAFFSLGLTWSKHQKKLKYPSISEYPHSFSSFPLGMKSIKQWVQYHFQLINHPRPTYFILVSWFVRGYSSFRGSSANHGGCISVTSRWRLARAGRQPAATLGDHLSSHQPLWKTAKLWKIVLSFKTLHEVNLKHVMNI